MKHLNPGIERKGAKLKANKDIETVNQKKKQGWSNPSKPHKKADQAYPSRIIKPTQTWKKPTQRKQPSDSANKEVSHN